MMISSISNHIPSGDGMAQAVSEHQNHDRPQDIKAHSQGTPDALNDFNALQSWFHFLIEQMDIGKKDKIIKVGSQQGRDDSSKAVIDVTISMKITGSIMAG